MILVSTFYNAGLAFRADTMHLHILGICGTFMGGLALLARAAGHTVTGCDAGVYPPMSTQLADQGITLIEGFDADQLGLQPDVYVIGNAITRGNPLLEAIFDAGAPYTSGPQWLGEHILPGRHVLAVAGTHGKTTTSSMLAWMLHCAGLQPGFLIGGVAHDLGVSAHYGPDSPYFVIEADEYDTALFDKRSKFLHYRPRTLILNNLEYDHADIFPDLAAIQTQFHHLVRTLPSTARIVHPAGCAAIDEVLARGCWSQTVAVGDGGRWQANDTDDGSFDTTAKTHWQRSWRRNMSASHPKSVSMRSTALPASNVAWSCAARSMASTSTTTSRITRRRLQQRWAGCVGRWGRQEFWRCWNPARTP